MSNSDKYVPSDDDDDSDESDSSPNPPALSSDEELSEIEAELGQSSSEDSELEILEESLIPSPSTALPSLQTAPLSTAPLLSHNHDAPSTASSTATDSTDPPSDTPIHDTLSSPFRSERVDGVKTVARTWTCWLPLGKGIKNPSFFHQNSKVSEMQSVSAIQKTAG